MNDAQITTLAITVIAILAGTLYNNVRISDLGARLDGRIIDTKEVIRAEMRLEFERTNNKIDALLKAIADVDQRVTRLEARL